MTSGRRSSRGAPCLAAFLVAAALGGCHGPLGEAAAPAASRDGGAARVDPQHLIGLDGARLVQLLGMPSFVRRDAAAEVWRYPYGTCVVYLFLYPEHAGAAATLRHVEVRGVAGSVASASDCRPAPREPDAEATES